MQRQGIFNPETTGMPLGQDHWVIEIRLRRYNCCDGRCLYNRRDLTEKLQKHRLNIYEIATPP